MPDVLRLQYLIGKTLVSDDDAVYDKVIRMDVSDLAPMVTWGPILLWSGL